MFRYLMSVWLLISVQAWASPWNSPYPKHHNQQNNYYTSFTQSPKTLDPARSYSSNEWRFIAQVYEPPLQYHYLLRPYQLEPLTLTKMPVVTYRNSAGKTISANADDIAYSVYDLYLKKGIRYQPHAAFAKNSQQQYSYHHLPLASLESKHQLSDFTALDSRELTAKDYVYQIKRLADPMLHSPVYSLMAKYIVGLYALHKNLIELRKQQDGFVDLRNINFAGAKALSRYHYQIILKGKYPQFIYWLAMPFFSPMPWEVDYFYSQAGMIEKNITLNWHPVGTGPYMLMENNPNRRMLLVRNPNFHPENYPSKGAPGDKAAGLLADAGKSLPFIDRIVFSLERESIPYWNKFLQGYYDRSGLVADNFDQAVSIDKHGKAHLTESLQSRGVYLQTSIMPSTFYMGFNMLDTIVGGDSQRARLLRQAISIAIDYEESIEIFHNGRGTVAQGPIPPGLFGYQAGEAGINPIIYQWSHGKAKRRSLADAKELLSQAGYVNGIDPKTKQPLRLNYDVSSSANPDDKALFSWLRKQFEKLGIDLHIRATQYNRFQEKMRNGQAQIFAWGWHADYPDPENFLFLLYGQNGKVKFGGENAANYHNKTYDRLFLRMRNLENNATRAAIIQQMLDIVRYDAPWIWGYHPTQFQLLHHWNQLGKPHAVANNTLKYLHIDEKARVASQHQWNQPVMWPLLIIALLLLLLLLPAMMQYWRKEYSENKDKLL